MKKEKKHFNRQYVPVIIGIAILIILIGLLVFFILNDKDINFHIGKETTTTASSEFEHEEITVDLSSSTCDKTELNNLVAASKKIGITYEVKEKNLGRQLDTEGDELEYDTIEAYIYVNLSNITDNMKFVITNSMDDDKIEFSGADAKNGTYSFKNEWTFEQNEFLISVYNTNDCIKTPIRKFKIVSPVVNIYYYRDTCNKNTKLYGTEYCEKVLYHEPYTLSEITAAKEKAGEKTYLEKVEEEMNEEENDNGYVLYIIIGIIAAIIIAVIVIIIVKKRKIKKQVINLFLVLFISFFAICIDEVNALKAGYDPSKMTCVSPGLGAAQKGQKMTCDQYDGKTKYAVDYILKNAANDHDKTLALRWQFISNGETNAGSTGGDTLEGTKKTKCISSILIQIKQGTFIPGETDIETFYSANDGYCDTSGIRSAIGTNDELLSAYNLINSASSYQKNQSESGGGTGSECSTENGEVTTTLKSSGTGSGKSKTVTFTYSGNGTIESAEVNCDNCSAGSPQISGKTITVNVTLDSAEENISPECRKTRDSSCSNYNVSVTAKIKGVLATTGEGCSSADNNYLCHIGGGSTSSQYYVYSPEEEDGTIEATGTYSGSNECEECTFEPGSIDPDLNGSPMDNCCHKNGQQLHYNQTPLNDLFTYNDCLGVQYYYVAKNGADKMLDAYANSQLSTEAKSYCKVYCSQKADIEIPGAITSHSGRYFKLTSKTTGGTTSAYVHSQKECRLVVDYDKWITKYYHLVEEEVENYNIYQEASALDQVYNEKTSVEDKENQDLNTDSGIGTSVSITCKRRVWNSGLNNGAGGYDDQDAGSFSADIKSVTGTIYAFSSDAKRDYYTIRINPDKHKFTGEKSGIFTNILVENDKNYTSSCANEKNYEAGTVLSNVDKSGETVKVSNKRDGNDGKYKFEHETGKVYSVAECNELAAAYNKALSEARKKCTDQGTEYYVSDAPDAIEPTDFKCENVAGKRSAIEAKITESNSNFKSAKDSIEPLEEVLTECDTYFTSKGSSIPDAYNVDSDMAFKYSQIYLDEDGKCVTDIREIEFGSIGGNSASGNCNISYAGESNAMYSTLYGSGNEEMKLPANNAYIKNTDNRPSNISHSYSADKLFSKDGTYKAECYKNESDNSSKNQTPTGYVILPNYETLKKSSTNVTIHNREYHIETSSMSGTYETLWQLSGIGEGGVFDDAIAGGKTCGYSSADGASLTKASGAHCSLSEDSEKIEGANAACTLTIIGQLIQTGKCNKNGEKVCPYDDPSIEVEGMNAFNFKIADPSNLFPACKSDSSCNYAQNWLTEDKGKTAKTAIEKAGTADTTYSPSNLTYSYKLTTKTLSEIKKYNEDVGTYDDFDLTCDCSNSTYKDLVAGTNTTIYTGCKTCKSTFIEAFYSTGKLSVGSGTYEFTVSGTKDKLSTLRKKTFDGGE